MNQDKKPEALRLAAWLDAGKWPSYVPQEAAAELRRQHARIAELEAELKRANQWRGLAMQSDGHRMQALWHLKSILNPDSCVDEYKAAGEFLKAAPLPGEQVLAQRIAELAALKAAPAPQAQDVQRDATRLDWCMNQYGFCYFIAHETGEYCESPQEIRAAIDAAIAASAKGEK